ncbi:Kelch repeat-containing protein 3 [Paramarasmius palmivorus]|uniref:Kelch repeat-containing protein 3 n=1 Tax=Paramarasmius palmivorus TaxID=297713 RepID=A0AAW0CKB6_9AGAR
MAKKKSTNSAAKAAKKAKAEKKAEKRTTKKDKKDKRDDDDSDDDLEAILEKMRLEWEAAHTVTEEVVEGPPSRRANATLIACPTGNYLWCIGGEYFSEDGRAYFVGFQTDQDEWRKFVSPTCPGPRSAHAVATTHNKIFLFGGEFSSLHQTTFHHYRDFWCFDIAGHDWERIDTKLMPSARSGHRMAAWKHFIVLFGGFYDPGITTKYHNDLWIFDTQEYKWRQIEFRENDARPSPRSGFSFLPTPDGIVLHGGYCKEYAKGKRPVGVMLDDTWFLSLSLPSVETADPKSPNATTTSKKASKGATEPPLQVKWHRLRRPSTAYCPTLRSGCTMTTWANRGCGVMFGGVTDEERGEEGLESVFHQDMNAYQWPATFTGSGAKGRWISLTLKKPKKKGVHKKKKVLAQTLQRRAEDVTDNEDEDTGDDKLSEPPPASVVESEVDPDDPSLTIPIPRYNAMLAVLRNTLYLYGGILERGTREYTLDDFHYVHLDKMEQWVCLRPHSWVFGEGEESEEDSGDEDDESDSEYDESGDSDGEEVDEPKKKKKDRKQEGIPDPEPELEDEPEPEPEDVLRTRAQEFMSYANTNTAENALSTPLPGETLAIFYARSREYWAQTALCTTSSDTRGKALRKDGFALAEARYEEYKPLLKEVEKILAEAGLDEEEMRRSAQAGGMGGQQGQNRNRR